MANHAEGRTAAGVLDDPGQVPELVRRFYAEVDRDDLLGPMFNEAVQVNWSEHLVELTAFWCRALFGIAGYQGSPFRAPDLVHSRRPFTPVHFERWLALFRRTLKGGWQGPKTDQAIELACKVTRMHAHQLVSKESCSAWRRGLGGASSSGRPRPGLARG
jgi:hemoglobin